MNIISNISKYKIYLLIIGFSLVFTEFYFFNWKTQFFVSNGYLIFNTLILFLFSLILFTFLYLFYLKLNNYLSSKIFRIIDTFFLTVIFFKIIQITFFFANKIHFKPLLALVLKKILIENLIYLIPFLKILIPYFLLFLLIFFLHKKNIEIMINFIISFSLVFLLFMAFDISKRISHTFYDDSEVKVNKNKRKVIWLLLDEYDPKYINNKYGLKLEYINQLIQKSVVHNRTFSPSDATLYSATSTLIKTQIRNLIFEEYQMKIIDDNENQKDFNIKNTLFHTINKNNLSYYIASESLPYCTMLRIKKNCEKNYNQLKYYFDGIIHIYTPLKYFPKLSEFFKKRDGFDIKKLNTLNDRNFNIMYLSKELNLDLKRFDKITSSNNNLFYFHLFLPHTNNKGHLVSSKHIRDEFNMSAKTDLDHYLMKLKYADILLNKILKILEKNIESETLLLLTSDHWRRVDSPNTAKPSLFIAKIIGDNTKYELKNDISNIFIPDLIINFLNKKIISHNDLKLFLDKLPFFDSQTTHIN